MQDKEVLTNKYQNTKDKTSTQVVKAVKTEVLMETSRLKNLKSSNDQVQKF